MIVFAVLLQAAVAQDSPKPAPAGRDKLICITEPVIGSRLGGHKICRTAAERERDRREGQDDLDRAQRLAKMPGQ